MTAADIVETIAAVPTMSGDPLSEILAPSELREIAETLLATGVIGSEPAAAPVFPPHLAWMATVPPHMRDCFVA